jgi:hypothetical protein
LNLRTSLTPKERLLRLPFASLARASLSQLLFYWSTFVIRLCFGSFIVAILVGAFNKVVSSEIAIRRTQRRDESLPSGFHDAADRSTWQSVAHFADFFITARLFGSYEPWLIQVCGACDSRNKPASDTI